MNRSLPVLDARREFRCFRRATRMSGRRCLGYQVRGRDEGALGLCDRCDRGTQVAAELGVTFGTPSGALS